jgi:agmatinase
LRHLPLSRGLARGATRGARAVGPDRPFQPDHPTYADFDPIAALNVVDCGDVELTPGRILDAYDWIERAVSLILEAGAVPVTIGGDGSVSVPVLRARAAD